MIPFLPPEIIQAIVAQLKRRRPWIFHSYEELFTKELARCCLTSKLFLSAAQPLLYKIIEVNLVVARHYDYSEPQYEIQHRERLLLRTLKNNQHLQNRIEQLQIEGLEDRDWSETGNGDDPSERIRPLVVRSPRLKIVEVRGLAQYSEVDDALSLAQTHRQSNTSLAGGAPSFHLVATEQGWECSGLSFSTVYEGYKYALWSPYRGSAWEEMLLNSHDTIRHLAITLDHAIILSNFHHLERLSLRLSARPPESPMPTEVDKNLLRILPTLPSVRFLLLLQTISETELSTLLRSDDFAHSLPPTLAHLCLKLHPDSSDVVTFIKALPPTSELKRLNYLGETGKEREIADACKERGIELSLNEEWEIW